jgi:hypothetical protein
MFQVGDRARAWQDNPEKSRADNRRQEMRDDVSGPG